MTRRKSKLVNQLTQLAFVLACAACSKENVQVIPADFQTYVDAFIEEGNRRGQMIEFDDIDLTIQYGSLDGTTAGLCAFRSNTVTIDQDRWLSFEEEQRTWLIFHELGHCLLDRQHKNETTPNDECISLMKGAEDSFDCSLNYYSPKWWDYYLDELFDPNTQLPDWYDQYSDYDAVSITDTAFFLDTIATAFELDDISLSASDNFSVDFKFFNASSNQPFIKFYLGNIGFSNCDACTGTNVRISSDSPQEVYYENLNGSITFDADIKLTIRNIDNQMYYYVNEKRIHTLESSIWSGNTLYTTQMNEAIRLMLTITGIE